MTMIAPPGPAIVSLQHDNTLESEAPRSPPGRRRDGAEALVARRPLAPPCTGPSSCSDATSLLAPTTGTPGTPSEALIGLPALEPLDLIAQKRSAYCGPTDESNWVLPGRLMVGAFPGVPEDDENDRVLSSILGVGVTTFVCLQREYDPRATEQQWRSGVSLRPYFEKAVEIAAWMDRNDDDVYKRQLSFIHFGIEDCSVGEDHAVTNFAVELAERLRSTNEIIYLHCWGGHGRTGTIVCLLLHLLYGLDDRSAFLRCQLVHDTRRIPIAVGSPQTQRQRDQVSRIIARLQHDDSHAKKRALYAAGMHHRVPVDCDEPPRRSAPNSRTCLKLLPNQVSFDDSDGMPFAAALAANRNPKPLPSKKSPRSSSHQTAATLPCLAKHKSAGAVASADDEPPAKKASAPRSATILSSSPPAKHHPRTRVSKPSPRHQRLQQRHMHGSSTNA